MDLEPGEFMLEESPPKSGHKFSAAISNEVVGRLIGQQWFRCQMCGIGAGEAGQYGDIAKLHIRHIVDKRHGGKDELSNLRVLCGPCKNGAKYLSREPPTWRWLGDLAREVGQSDWSAALQWLDKRFAWDAKPLPQRPPNLAWLLGQFERAAQDDQLSALEWLKKEFPEEQ